MDRRITIAFVAILALLGGYIWYTFLRADAPPTTPITPEPTQILFLTLERDKVQSLQVRDVKNNQTTRVVRDGDKWKMEQPAQGEAFSSGVDDLLFEVSRIVAERKLAPQADLAQFGLNPPKTQLEIGLSEGSPITVLIGNQNSEGDKVYAQKGDAAAIYLLDSSVGETIQDFVTTPPFTPTPSATPEPTKLPEATPTP